MADRSIWPIRTGAVALQKWDSLDVFAYLCFVDRVAAEISAVPTFPDLSRMALARNTLRKKKVGDGEINQ
jgi:hypothetical protein